MSQLPPTPGGPPPPSGHPPPSTPQQFQEYPYQQYQQYQPQQQQVSTPLVNQQVPPPNSVGTSLQDPLQQSVVSAEQHYQQQILSQQHQHQQQILSQQQHQHQQQFVSQQQQQQQQQTFVPFHEQGNPVPQQIVQRTTSVASTLTEPPADQAEQIAQSFASNLKAIGKRFTTTPEHDGPNIGFKPTAAMVKSHEENISSVDRPHFQFQVTKLRSWRTGYVRLLSLYENRFCTFDPDSHQVTNTWSYAALTDWMAMPKEKDVILLQVASDKLKFKCHNVERAVVLSALLQRKVAFEKTSGEDWPTFRSCARLTRHGSRIEMSIRVCPHGLQELHPTSAQVIQTYAYTDIVAVSFTTDEQTGVIVHLRIGNVLKKSRLFFIQSSRRHGNGRSDLLTLMREHYETLGIELQIQESSALPVWLESRRALGSNQTVVMTWDVTKTTPRHDAAIVGPGQGWLGGTVSRTLAVTSQGCLLELDGGGVVSMRSLTDVHALVRHSHSDQITIEYNRGFTRVYGSSHRDGLLVSLLDAATNLANNRTLHVSDVTSSGYSLLDAALPEEPGGLFQPISIPLYCLKRVHTLSTAAYSFLSHSDESSTRSGQPVRVVEECTVTIDACREFNATVTPTGEGLPKSSNDKYVFGCTGALWGIVAKLLSKEDKNSRDCHQAELAATPIFQTLYRLSQTPAAFKGTAELSTFQESIKLLWDIEDKFCQFWAFRVLSTLMASSSKPRDREVEYVNKCIILQTGGRDLIDGIVATILDAGAKRPDGKQVVSDLTLMVTSDILQSILCSNHDTTKPEYFAAFIEALGKGYRALLASLRSETPFVIENTSLLLHLLSSHAPATAAAIRDAALSSGILIQHFHAAIFSPLEGQRFLSRYLCSLWLSGPMTCDEKRLLKRMVPSGFMGFLTMPILSKTEEEQLDELERDGIEASTPMRAKALSLESTLQSTTNEIDAPTGAAGTNTSRLRSRIAIASDKAASMPQHSQPENFRIFFHVLTKDHALPDLIWNQQTRRELRISLENEIQSIKRETDARGGLDHIAWNHQQFTVAYPSLDDEVRVGNVYMRLWLQAGDGFIKSWDEPVRLFEILFRRFLCELDRNAGVTIMCIRCLERLYMFHSDKIGAFQDIMILVHSMASTKSVETQHRLLALVATLLGVSSDQDRFGTINIPDNAEQLLNLESIGQFCQFVAWCHTNGIQVGNLLSTTLQIPENRMRMLTDGSSRGPGGDENSGTPANDANKNESADSGCPAVWFVASTGKTPPPTDKIRGPFRVSELKKMMNDGDLQPFDQVTASNVDDYDEDVIEGRLKEAQIDTGKWRRLEQVWQLRWQLCTDGNTTGIFSPAEVSLMALRALTRLVDLHKSLDTRGVPYFPVPIAKRLLCGLSRESSNAQGATAASGKLENYLSILSQSLLCNDHRVVEATAELLHKLLRHNEGASSKFYLTGAFFFLCCYTGSNFQSLGRLLSDLHLKQQFRSGFAAAADETELSVKDRSILGNMLPEGVLYVLVNYGFEKFSEIFVGNFDTPEVIWNFDMRKHLVEMVRQHLGDFPQRLWQNTTTEYDYCPIPGIAFKRLEREIFCHNYYLHNLCDEARFPDWPIAEPVELFRACLEEWKHQMNRDEVMEEDAREQARKVLDLQTGDTSKELRQAYRKLARQFHPDKNPAGRDMFEKIQTAYELLLPIVESGETITARVSDGDSEREPEDVPSEAEGLGGGRRQMKAVHLLLRTQLLVCKRYPAELSQYKYPAYRMVLLCISLPTSCKNEDLFSEQSKLFASPLLHSRRAEFVKTVAELIFETCAVSPLNAEELVAEGGVGVLSQVLDFYVKVVSYVAKSNEAMEDMVSNTVSLKSVLDIITLIVHTLAGVSFFECGRDAILQLRDVSTLSLNWRRCVEGNFGGVQVSADATVALKKYALEGLAYLAKTKELQHLLVGCGIVWPLLRYMLAYDPTLEQKQSGSEDDDDDVQMSQAASNTHARLSARALGMLCGVLKHPGLEAPCNEALYAAVSKLLTPPLARMLRNKRTGNLLRALNSNIESPVRIWNVKMRNELSAFVLARENERPEERCHSLDDQLRIVNTSFEYATLKNEITIGGVYLRVFNGAGGDRGSLNEIPSLSSFAKNLFNFIARCLNESQKGTENWAPLVEYKIEDSVDEPLLCSIEDPKFEMALHALRVIMRVDGMIDDIMFDNECHGPSILLTLLELPQESKAFGVGCEILAMVSPKQAFADAVASQGTLWRLLHVLQRHDANSDRDTGDATESQALAVRQQKGWSLLEALSSSPSIASQLIQGSGWIELLGIVAGYSGFTKTWTSRQGAAKALSRLLWDPSTGPLASALVQRLLPNALAVVLKEEGPDSMLRIFDGESETPELIWGSEMRSELRLALAEKLDERFSGSFDTQKYDLPPGFRVQYRKLEDELYLGGVYVRLYLKEPTFNLRDPTTFLKHVLQRWTHEMELFTLQKGETGDDEAPPEDSHQVVTASQDKLELVTSATVYLCKVRANLCDKLAEWGYITKSVAFMKDVLIAEMIGAPLLSIIRLLHVASNRMPNVEMIAVAGSGSGFDGIVDYTMQAIGSDSLHPDCAFIVEMLKKVFKLALGDVEKAKKLGMDKPSHPHLDSTLPVGTQKYYGGATDNLTPQAMAPSPAPGPGSVRKTIALDDPLAVFRTEPSPSQPPGQATRMSRTPVTSNPLQPAHQNQANPLEGVQQFQQQVHQRVQRFQHQAQDHVQNQVQQYVQTHVEREAKSQFERGTTWAQPGEQRNQFSQSHPLAHQGQVPYVQQMQNSHVAHPQEAHNRQLSPPFQFQQSPQLLTNTTGSYAQRSQMLHGQQPHQHVQHQSSMPQSHQYGQYPSAPPNVPSLPQEPYPNFWTQNSTNPLMEAGYQQQSQVHPTQPYAVQANAPAAHQYPSTSQQQWGAQTPYATNLGQVPPPQPILVQHQPQVSMQGVTNSQYQPQQATFQQVQPASVPSVFTQNQQDVVYSQPATHQARSPGVPTTQHTNLQTYAPVSQTVPLQPNHIYQEQHMTQPSSLPHIQQQQSIVTPTPNSQPQSQPAEQSQYIHQGSHIQPQNQLPPLGNHIQPAVWKQSEEPAGTPSKPIEGTGIDARAPIDPNVVAEQQTMAVGGAPGAAQGRISLIQSALACKLAEFLLNDVLENASLANIKDQASAKVHTVELLKLLTMDPAYGMKFKLILEKEPCWRKYKSQDHSLFITGTEQKADYFLTDGTSGPTMLLTEK